MSNSNVSRTDRIREALGAAESIPVAELAEKRPRVAEALGFISVLLPQVKAELNDEEEDTK